jgi:Transglycosylase-like domain
VFVRCTLASSLLGLALLMTTLPGSAHARSSPGLDRPAKVRTLRVLLDHYRDLTWTYESAAHLRRTAGPVRARRSRDAKDLQRAIDAWTRRAYLAERRAVAVLHRRLLVPLPAAPRLHARLYARVSYSRRLALSLRRIYPGHVTRRFASARAKTAPATLHLWQERSASAALVVSRHEPAIPDSLHDSFLCIHRLEGAWNSNSGNGYYGGLQLDLSFQSLYGREFLARFGTADRWPVWAQLQAAVRAYRSGRGFTPWPRTAHFCGLL